MRQQDDDTSSDMTSDDEDDGGPTGGETPPPQSVDPDALSGPSPQDLSPPAAVDTSIEVDSSDGRGATDREAQLQDAEFYQHVMSLLEDRKPQNTIQDNMESYGKLLFLGVQLAEDSRHSHMTQSRPARANRGTYPSTSRGLSIMAGAKESEQQQGVSEDEFSCCMIMENLIKDMSSPAGRAREQGKLPPMLPGALAGDWEDEPHGTEAWSTRGQDPAGSLCRLTTDLAAMKRTPERERRCHLDIASEDAAQGPTARARKQPFECGCESGRALSGCGPGTPTVSQSQAVAFRVLPYLCEECGRSFGVISEFVEHQIMHTRESLYEYGEAFIRGTAAHGVPSRGVRHARCEAGRETWARGPAPAGHQITHTSGCLPEQKDLGGEGAEMPSPTFRELQRLYGRNKFYACPLCGDSFLHSSALARHREAHGAARGELGGGEGRRQSEPQREAAPGPRSACCGQQKTRDRGRLYECEACSAAFLHSSALKQHQKVHLSGVLPEHEGELCEEGVLPAQALGGGWKAGREPLGCSGEHQESHAPGSFLVAPGSKKPAVPRRPLSHSWRSRAASRPPGQKDLRRALATATHARKDHRGLRMARKVRKQRPWHGATVASPGSVGMQEGPGVGGPGRPELTAASPAENADAINCRGVCAHGGARDGKGRKRPVASSAAPTPPKRRHSGNEPLKCGEKGRSSIRASDLNEQWQTIPARGEPHEKGQKSTSWGAMMQTIPHAGEFKPGATFPVPGSLAHGREEAGATEKHSEPRSSAVSVVRRLPLGELPARFPPGADPTGHCGFHPKEAATAQRVEADVPVPQDALQIQGSNADAVEPDVEAAEASRKSGGPDREAEQPGEEADRAGIRDPEKGTRELAGDTGPDGAGIKDPEEGDDPEVQVGGLYYSCPECARVFLSRATFDEHLHTHASVIVLEPANALGECTGYIKCAGACTGMLQASGKHLRREVCGQPCSGRLGLARPKNTCWGVCGGWRAFT